MNIERGINIIIKVLTLHFQRIREVDQLLVKNSINYSGGHLTRVKTSSRYGRHKPLLCNKETGPFNSFLSTEKPSQKIKREPVLMSYIFFVSNIFLRFFLFFRLQKEKMFVVYNLYSKYKKHFFCTQTILQKFLN